GVHHSERLQQGGRAGRGARRRTSRPQDRRRPPAAPRRFAGLAVMATAAAACRWSVVIPAYNEEARLPGCLREVVAYFDGRGEPYEVIVVDDGSSDRTPTEVAAIARQHPAVQIERFNRNHGKGFAVRAGMVRARGALRLMADADGATPIAEVKRLEAALDRGADLAV